MFSRRFVHIVVSLSLGAAFVITTSPVVAQCELHETQKLIASNGGEADGFGSAVSISGNALVVGARYHDCALGADCGSAYVFRLNGANWVQEAELIPSGLAAFDHFGGGVAVDGERIVVGAVHYEANYVNLASAAYVFRFDGTAWVEEAKLIPPDAAQLDLFRPSVAVGGDRVFLGAYGGYGVSGALYIFRRQGTAWVQEAKLLPPELCRDGSFGGAVSVYGNRVLVGGPGNLCQSNVASPPGAAYVFRREGTNWLLEARLPRPPGFTTQVLGVAVSLSDKVALVGHVVGDHDPAVSVYRRSGTGWSFEALLGPFVGNSAFLSVATEGDAVVVGGVIPVTHVFIRNGNNWPEVAQLTASDAPGGYPPVSMSGDNVLLGAYVFELPHDCNANGVADACDIASGTSQDLDGNGYPDECCVAVGSPVAEPDAVAKNRYITLVPGNPGCSTALRVTLSSLHHPDPPTLPSRPQPDFSSFENQVRWVGPPSDFPESSSDSRTFKAAKLQCSPHYMDWSVVGPLHVYGDAIVPSSLYDVQAVTIECSSSIEANYSLPPLSVTTSRWADVAPPYQQTCAVSGCSPCTAENCVSQPNVLDITGVVNTLKSLAGAPSKVEAQLQPNAPDPFDDLNVLDVVVAVDAVKEFGYPYPGPSVCPP